MGFLDDVKKKASGLVKGRSDEIAKAVDKVADLADDRTKGKHRSKIDSFAEKAKGVVDDLDPEADADPKPPVDPKA